jgi:hypothetical protein
MYKFGLRSGQVREQGNVREEKPNPATISGYNPDLSVLFHPSTWNVMLVFLKEQLGAGKGR